MSFLKLFQDKKANIRYSVILFLAVAFLIFLYFFNSSITITPLYSSKGISFDKARVVEIIKDNLQPDGTRTGNQLVKVELLSGAHKGKTYQATSLDSYLYGAACQIGTRVIVQISTVGNDVSVSVFNYDRSTVLYVLIALFLFVLWLIGGKKGIKSALGIIFTLICILFLYLPMMYKGFSPFFAAVVVVALTTVVSMYLIGGPTIKTAASVISTLLGVVIAGCIATLFGNLAHLSGYNVADIENMMFIAQNSKLQIGSLLFSGILIASLGAVMDVGISIASTINEIHEKNPELGVKSLFHSGINVGRDMMGTMSNTLILAYAGSSVTVLISMYAYNYPYNEVINLYSIGIEILQGLSGTLGVVLTVPICSAVSAWMFSRENKRI